MTLGHRERSSRVRQTASPFRSSEQCAKVAMATFVLPTTGRYGLAKPNVFMLR
jgi:hypothetical protein